MNFYHRSVRAPRLSFWLASLTAAGLLSSGAAGLRAQTAATWNGGTGNWSNDSLWSTGSAPYGSNYDVYIDGGKTGTASVVTLDNVYAVGRLTVDAGDTLNMATSQYLSVNAGAFAGSGSFVNNGTINGANLVFAGGGTISGTGTINLNGGSARLYSADGNLVTIGAGQTVAGAGLIYGGSFTNQGTITANQNGNMLTLQPPSNNYTLTTTGNGAARAENGGTLVLNGGTYSGGTFTALTGSQVQVPNNGAVISGATLASSGTGVVTINAATLTNTTLSGSVVAPNGASITLNGTLTNNGTFTLNSTGSGAALILGSPTTIGGTGTISMVGTGDNIRALNTGDRLTVGSGQTIQGVGNLGTGLASFANGGNLLANVNGGTLTIQPSSGTGTFVNQVGGTVAASNGGAMVLSNASSGTFTNQGSFSVTANSTFSVAAGALTNFSGTTLTGGSYFASAASASTPATLSFGGGSIVTNNASVTLNGPGAVFNEINALATNASNGTFNLSGGHDFTTAGALTNAGVLDADASKLTVAGALTNSGQTTVSTGGTVTVQGNATNSGKLSALVGTVAVQGTLNRSGTLLVLQNGAITSSEVLTVPSPGTVIGSGNLTAPSLALAGTLFPGDTNTNQPAVGTLTLNGAVSLTGGTKLVFDLAGTAASDQIQVNGALTLDGTLTVNALAGFGAGRYDLLNYTGALTNNTLDLGTLPVGYNYAIDTSIAGQVDLVVTNAVPEPSTWAWLGFGASGLLLATRRRRGRT